MAASGDHPPLYTPFKRVSAWLAPRLSDTRLSSNALTIGWGLLLAAAAVALAWRRPGLALALVMPAILLDCLDGDLARCRHRPSISGTYLEQITHWFGNMALMAGAGAAILLEDPRPGNVLLASTLTVVQSIYIAVVRQVRADAAEVPEQPRLCAAFRAIIELFWNLSPIELPLLAVLVVLGVTRGAVLGITVALAVASLLIFVPHFLLVRAADRRAWALTHEPPPDTLAELWSRDAAAIVVKCFPDARWWTPGAPQLPAAMLTLMGRQPMAAGAPILMSVWRELQVLLPRVFRTKGRVLPLACPTDAAWEAVLGTLARPGDELLVAGGRAANERLRGVAERLGLRVVAVDRWFGHDVEPAELETVLAQHPAVRMVCLQLAEADDGMRTDIAAISERLGRSKLVIVDASLSLCADDLHMDAWGLDVVISSSSSGLMAPPGLSLVGLGTRVLEQLEGSIGGGYLDLRAHLGAQDRPLAPLPTPALAGLYVAVELILAAGLDTVIEHRRRMAELFRRGCASRAGLTLVGEQGSAACTVAWLPEGVSLAELQGCLFASMQMVMASGTTPDGQTTLQFGHAGWVFESDVERVIDEVALHVG